MRRAIITLLSTGTLLLLLAAFLFDPFASPRVHKDDGGGGGGMGGGPPAPSSGPTTSDVHVDSIMGPKKSPKKSPAACKRCGKVHAPTTPPAIEPILKGFDPFNLGQTCRL